MAPDPKDQSKPEVLARAGRVSEPSPLPRGKLVALLVVGAIAGAMGYRMFADAPSFSEPSPAGRKVVHLLIRSGDAITVPEGSPVRDRLGIEPVVARDFRRDLVLPAVVEAEPSRLIKVLPPLAGRITHLNVQLGERVQAGQPLVVIDSPDLGTAYSDYGRAKVLLSLALRNRDRERELAKIGAAAQKDLQQSETDYVTAEVEYQRATAHLKQIGADPDAPDKTHTVTVVAPMAGSIIDLGVAPGEYWNDPTAALMTIADLKTVWVTASVPEKDTAFVSTGQSVSVTFPAYPGEVFRGNVLFVSDVLDPDTRRTKVRIAFDNSRHALKPGMFANATFAAPPESRLVVPTSALVMVNDSTKVFVETAPWKFEARAVRTGFQDGDVVAITRGLNQGDRVVVRGAVLLND